MSAAAFELGGPLPAGSRLGRYEVLAKLAAGGMAVVYVARAQGIAGFERLVALKVLHANLAHEDEFIRMFLDEARLAARVRHPNVVPTTDISDNAKVGYFLVMDYIEGDHLGALLSNAHKAGQRLPINVVLRIVADALAGLGAAHNLTDEKGELLRLVHRDVSPHNIMVGSDGVARLTDFGVAKAEDRLTHTRDGQVKGKLAYMAPEQASSGAADTRSDLFSMGIILWECLTGRRLFRMGSTAQTLNKLLNDEVPAVSSVDQSLAPLDPLLKRALQRDPDRRFQTADEFVQAIEEAAVAYGGLARLRIVGEAVKTLVAAKLQRDKSLIEDAIQAIKQRGTASVPFEAEPTSDPSMGSASSQSQSSLSVSKASGVYSYATGTGTRPDGPRVRRTTGANLPAPPPIGIGIDGRPITAGTQHEMLDEFPDERQPRQARWFMWLAAICLGLAAAWYFSMSITPPEAKIIEVPAPVPAREPALTAESAPIPPQPTQPEQQAEPAANAVPTEPATARAQPTTPAAPEPPPVAAKPEPTPSPEAAAPAATKTPSTSTTYGAKKATRTTRSRPPASAPKRPSQADDSIPNPYLK